MVGSIRGGGGGAGVSLARAGHGDRRDEPGGPSGGGRPIAAGGRDSGSVSSGNDAQAVDQSAAFESVLSSIAFQMTSDSMADFDDAMGDMEEDA